MTTTKFISIVASAGIVLLVGCATNPKSALPALQQEVASRGDTRVVWPQDAAGHAAVDQAVADLLAHELTPDSAAQIAVLNNRHLRATLEDLGVSQADVLAAGRLPNPTLAASVRWSNRAPRGPDVEFSLGADLLNAVLLPLRKKVANEQLGQTQHRVAREVLELTTDVKTAALTVQAGQELRARLAAIVQVNAAAADLAQRQFDAGNISQLDLAQQQAVWQQARLDLAQGDAQLRADREKLNRLLGFSAAQTNWQMPSILPEPPASEPALNEVEDIAVAQRLDLAAATSKVTLAHAALKLKRETRLLPVSANLGVDTERNTDGSRVTGPNLQLSLPLFDQGQPEIARLEAELRRAEANADALASDIRSEARAARDRLQAARAAVEFHETTLLPQRQLILRETLLHYNAMQKDNYELLAAKEREQQAERDGLEALRDYWIARVELERALGGRLPAESGMETVPAKP
jgi:cobalt-zinc-cadmium efflux system outer membrane protein